MVTIFFEGGGDQSASLKTACRKGLRSFLKKAGLTGKMPRIIACGGRQNAFERYKHSLALANGGIAILLVDSECSVSKSAADASPWEHVLMREGDKWKKPVGANDLDLHFMVECMENWFMADKETLAQFYHQNFKANQLPKRINVEENSKLDVYAVLKKATKSTQKGEYSKGAHSFELLAKLDPKKVRDVAPYADRFLAHLDEIL